MNFLIKGLAILLYLCYSLNLNATTVVIDYPRVVSKNNRYCVIRKICLADEYTEIFFRYMSPYGKGGWINFSDSAILQVFPSISIRPVFIMGIEGIPYAPDKHVFEEIGEEVCFSLKFPAIPKDTKSMGIYERVQGGFEFIIRLTSDASAFFREEKRMYDGIHMEHLKQQIRAYNEPKI